MPIAILQFEEGLQINGDRVLENEIIYFKSGLKMIHKQMTGVRSVAIGVMFAVGSASETEANNGISHFIEHMMFKGTKKRSAYDIVCEIDGLGAQINAYTSKQSTCYYTISVDEYAENCMEIMSDFLFNSTFDQAEMEKEKGVVLEEIAMSEDTPDDLCMENLGAAYFRGSSMGFTILGDADNIRNFKSQDLHSYVANKYSAGNMIVSVVGNIDQKKAYDLVAKYFDSNVFKSDYKMKKIKHEPKCESVIVTKPLEQANIALAFPCLEFGAQNNMSLLALNTIFGGGMSSRLFQEVREKAGLAYNIYSYPSAYYGDGVFSIYIGTNPKTARKALDSIREQIVLLKNEGISKDELERVKKQIKGSYALSQESSSSLMRVYGRNALFLDEYFDFDEKIRQIDFVSQESVMEVVNYIFDFDKVVSSYVGKEIDFDPLAIIRG